jgi:hypothetical protein
LLRRVLDLKSDSVQGVKGDEIGECWHSIENGKSAFNSFRPTLIDLRVAAKTGLEAMDTLRNIVVAESLVLLENNTPNARLLCFIIKQYASCRMQQWTDRVTSKHFLIL